MRCAICSEDRSDCEEFTDENDCNGIYVCGECKKKGIEATKR